MVKIRGAPLLTEVGYRRPGELVVSPSSKTPTNATYRIPRVARMLSVLTRVMTIYVLFISLYGCATMSNQLNEEQTIMVNSSRGKDVRVNISTPNRAYEDSLPTSITARRGSENIKIQVTDKRYVNRMAIAEKEINPAFFANIGWLHMFWLGMTVDATTGAMWKYTDTVTVTTIPK